VHVAHQHDLRLRDAVGARAPEEQLVLAGLDDPRRSRLLNASRLIGTASLTVAVSAAASGTRA
jgi:hypothetical protein